MIETGHYIPGAYVSDFKADEIDTIFHEWQKRKTFEPYICACCGAPKPTPFYCEYCGTHYAISGGNPDPAPRHMAAGTGGRGSGALGVFVMY